MSDATPGGTKRRRRRRPRLPAAGRAWMRKHRRWIAGAAVLAVAAVALGLRWLGHARHGAGRPVPIVWPEEIDSAGGAALLAGAGVVDGTAGIHALLALTRPFVTLAPGPHLLTDDLTPAEVVRRLARLSSRARTKVVVPEGFTRFQIAARLEQARVCAAVEVDRATTDPTSLARLGIGADSAEGYLAPATYDLFADTAASGIVVRMVEITAKRLADLRAAHPAEFAGLSERFAFGDREIVTLASVVEHEAAKADELPLVASVFYNRLADPSFRPARTLQSDATAAYGCVADPTLPSCAGYSGRVTPVMLRDPANPYNTYRHPGLPPGPIGNPGVRALDSVVVPATTDYLFFVASGDGRHTFSRTLAEHEAVFRRGH